MEIKITEVNGLNIAEVVSDKFVITDIQDAIDLMANCNYQDCGRIVIRESNLSKDFFDLKTGIAGDILQKFSNYKVRLAIAGDFLKYPGKSLRDFIFESNKHGRIIFVDTIQEAYDKLSV